jgi:hypothetical protein
MGTTSPRNSIADALKKCVADSSQFVISVISIPETMSVFQRKQPDRRGRQARRARIARQSPGTTNRSANEERRPVLPDRLSGLLAWRLSQPVLISAGPDLSLP